MVQTLEIKDFVAKLKSTECLLIDARSETEFKRGHVPGAVNLPLLNDNARAEVGTLYKQKGRQAAVEKGFELAGPEFHKFIDFVRNNQKGNTVLVYCWRGGMRSGIMAWILGLAGFQVILLKGGYKQYRKLALESFNIERPIMVLGGKTGTGKTDLLSEMSRNNEIVIDLEALANHRGSVYGDLGQNPQPTQEHFENLLAWQWMNIESNALVWLENESSLIGHLKIPNVLFENMRNCVVIEVHRDFEVRLQRIVKEYGCFDKKVLAEKTTKVQKRLGGLRLQQALEYLDKDNIEGWAGIMLQYYDDTYKHSNSRRQADKITEVVYNENKSIAENARLIIAAKHSNTAEII